MTRVPFRQQIEGLTDAEAVEYLLEQMEGQKIGLKLRMAAICDRWDTAPVGPFGLAMLICLWDRRNRVVLAEQIQFFIESNLEIEFIGRRALSTHAKKLRQAVARNEWPMTLTPEYSLGWRLDVSDPEFQLEPV